MTRGLEKTEKEIFLGGMIPGADLRGMMSHRVNIKKGRRARF